MIEVSSRFCPLQSSFISGRGTTDNIIIAREVMHNMHRSKRKQGPLAANNIDLEKAYDRVGVSFTKLLKTSAYLQ